MGLANPTFLLLQYYAAVLMVTGPVLGVTRLHQPIHTLQTDKMALLEFKRLITSDPMFIFSNWNEQSDVCNFTKVRCDKKHHRVANLSVMDAGLVGILSPFLSNLTGLRVLQLVNNLLYGPIPTELSSLRFLRRLRLDGNNLQGPIPSAIFGLLPRKKLVSLNNNNFTGSIPPSLFSNCSVFKILDLSNNSLVGDIPREIGNCQNLISISLYSNWLTGELPSSLTNISGLRAIDVEYNHIRGELPSDIVRNMPSLSELHLSYNDMRSHENNTNLDIFFTSLINCTYLGELELAGMGLGGRLDSIGTLSTSLMNLLLQENRISGSISPSLSNFPDLMVLNLTSNLLNGSIPPELGNLQKLQDLSISYNLLNGAIPPALSRARDLMILDLANNRLSGEIPAELGNMGRLYSVFLNNNFLSGKIPPTLGQLVQLLKLDLSNNQLSGEIPTEIITGIREIRIYLNLSNNDLEGSLPLVLSKLEKVQEMDFSMNRFSGNIFSLISSCIELRVLNLSNNSLGGPLPDTLSELKNLESLDVSGNQLSGTIPVSLSVIKSLTFLDLSFNNFRGRIPHGGIFNSITFRCLEGNRLLCGTIPGMQPCSKGKHLFHSQIFLVVFILIMFASTCLSIVCCVIGVRRIRRLRSSSKTDAATTGAVGDMLKPLELVHNFPRISYKELSEATEGFDGRRLIGSGSYGRVYKGVLPDGTPIAVKVLAFQSGNSTKSFNRECQVLKRIRHRNLIRIITACSLPDFKALVLPYMANGSLDSRLYPHSETGLSSGSSDLSLIQRVNICSDVAEGMAYLHHHSPVKVIHCDLKPSNILLNDDMTALVSDFGIARLVTAVGGNYAPLENMGNSTTNMLSGSIGYIAPEYGFGANTSTKGDVYSFGILVLEMVTRKRPTDDMFVSGLSLHKWVKSHYHGRAERVIDSSLLRASRDQSPEVMKMWEVAIAELIELGILCTQDSPSTRPTMLDAADDLDRLKRYLSGDTTATFASSLGISSTVGDE
ncbi:hypothetical protein SAY87_002352 [Trapa incisa]|uniref:non-specific serine/threonine protein kinase n=1 Tax=Trapa incisa TaxID=236973 RepID=A0AAN7PV48_9MYRT|nr:hypothetical protein SAY87_002352 [Trapa incisa]